MKKSYFAIDQSPIEEHGNIFIIAEAGVNHNGEIEKALALVDIASKVGANAIKFQTFHAEDVATERAGLATYQKRNMGKAISQREALHPLELNEKDYPKILNQCRDKNILFLSTPHGGRASVDFLESLGVVAYKIGSGDLTNYILLKRVAQTRKPILLSSGMATLQEVKESVAYLRERGVQELAILHTTTNYPCPPQEVNLRAVVTMMDSLDVPIGFSDHTDNDLAAIAATSLGMSIYECHFTLDKKLPGPDHLASCSPDDLQRRIQSIRETETILGSGIKTPTLSELQSMRTLVRKSIVYTETLEEGHLLNEWDLEAKRPGDGVSPKMFEEFLNKRLTRKVHPDKQLQPQDIEK